MIPGKARHCREGVTALPPSFDRDFVKGTNKTFFFPKLMSASLSSCLFTKRKFTINRKKTTLTISSVQDVKQSESGH